VRHSGDNAIGASAPWYRLSRSPRRLENGSAKEDEQFHSMHCRFSQSAPHRRAVRGYRKRTAVTSGYLLRRNNLEK
jgi:hypothetical protein